MPTPPGQSCGNCAYGNQRPFRSINPPRIYNALSCCYNPPSPADLASNDPGVFAYWPQVQSSYWCGFWSSVVATSNVVNVGGTNITVSPASPPTITVSPTITASPPNIYVAAAVTVQPSSAAVNVTVAPSAAVITVLPATVAVTAAQGIQGTIGPAGPAGHSDIIYGSATMDFGASPVYASVLTVSGQASIGANSPVQAWVMNDEVAGAFVRLTPSPVRASVGFDIHAVSTGPLATGQLPVRWAWSP